MFKLLLICSLLISTTSLLGQKSKVLIVPIKKEISPSTTRLLTKGIEKATKDSFDLIVLDMNTFGGLLVEADSSRSAVLNCKIPIWVYINKNAASAGALISLACDKIYMQSASNIGAATVVTEDGDQAPDKYQSYMRGLMRATAESHGRDSITNLYIRDPKIAEAMVDESVVIEGLSNAEQVVTLTTNEAIKYGYCDGKANSISELLQKSKLKDAVVETQKETSIDKIIGWLLSPAVRGILIAGIVFGLYFEIQSPGLGIPSLAALLSALLYFAPAYIEGLAENWEIIIFLIGLILILLELLVIPGFGFAGIAGIALTITSLVLAMLRNVNLDFSLVGFSSAFFTVAIIVGLFIIIGVLLYFKPINSNSSFFSKIVHNETLSSARVNSFSASKEDLIGKRVRVFNACKPEGKIEHNGTLYHATSTDQFLEKNQIGIVIDVEQNRVILRKA